MQRKDDYRARNYMHSKRWTTYSEIIQLVLKMNPDKILEIGIGNRFLASILEILGYSIKTADIDGSLNPDYILDVRDKSKLLELSNQYDLIIASEIFEHINYAEFIEVIKNLRTITRNLIISLPYTNDHASLLSVAIKLPFSKHKFIILKKFYLKKSSYIANKSHLWEIGIRGFPLRKIKRDIKISGWNILENFLNDENPYHYILKMVSKN